MAADRCLRRRLSTFSCDRCLTCCPTGALTENGRQICHDPNRCLACGACMSSCPGEVFTIEGFDFTKTMIAAVDTPGCVLSCVSSPVDAARQLAIPCVGVLSPQALIFLAVGATGTIHINLSICATCPAARVATSLAKTLLRLRAGMDSLFNAGLILVDKPEMLPRAILSGRRAFLRTVGQGATRFIRSRWQASPGSDRDPARQRRVPAGPALLRRLLQDTPTNIRQLLSRCTPDAHVSSACVCCSRCKAMCPSGALRLVRQGERKSLVFDRTLCSACGLCVEFCAVGAIAIIPAWITRDTDGATTAESDETGGLPVGKEQQRALINV